MVNNITNICNKTKNRLNQHMMLEIQLLVWSRHKFAAGLNLGDNCIWQFQASTGDLIVANWAYWWQDSGTSKRIFATMKSTIDAVKLWNTIQLSPKWFTEGDLIKWKSDAGRTDIGKISCSRCLATGAWKLIIMFKNIVQHYK